MPEKKEAELENPKTKRTIQGILLELLRYRSSLVRLYHIVHKHRLELKAIEKKISSNK